jgi:hypothetical protein
MISGFSSPWYYSSIFFYPYLSFLIKFSPSFSIIFYPRESLLPESFIVFYHFHISSSIIIFYNREISFSESFIVFYHFHIFLSIIIFYNEKIYILKTHIDIQLSFSELFIVFYHRELSFSINPSTEFYQFPS